MTSRTDSRIRSTPSPARNASSSSDATDWDNAIGGNLPGEYLPVHTENPADGPLTQAGSPTTRNPTTPGDSHRGVLSSRQCLAFELGSLGLLSFSRTGLVGAGSAFGSQV